MEKIIVTNNDPLLMAMRNNIDNGYCHEQVERVRIAPRTTNRLPDLDEYDSYGTGMSRKTLAMGIHGTLRGY